MAFKTFQQLTVATDVQDGDLFAKVRGSGAMTSVTGTVLVTYLTTKFPPATRLLSAAGLATGGGDLSADRTFTVPAAAAADIRTGSDNTKAVTSTALMSSMAPQTLTDAATIAFNVANGFNATVTPSVSGRTIGAPTGGYSSEPICLEIVNSAGGTLAVNWTGGAGGWDFGALGLPSVPASVGGALKVYADYNARTGKWDANSRRSA